ncbi:MAG: 3-phosphoshikimate 1-carboxyvinyltransferase [Acidobacteria bacterium]|nr:3-phosphoshikimate 1-carboxyvinyltransferase [Acidobacteriota bacterium]
MKSFLAFPPARELRGSLRVPSSKSATNRALLLAALSETPVRIERPLQSEDTRALLACLMAMGACVVRHADALSLSGPLRGSEGALTVLDAGESGTAARFLTAAAAATPGRFRVVGSARLSERPMGELAGALRALGADIAEEGAAGCLPLAIRGTTLGGGPVSVDSSRSSQFLSALLLAGAAGRSIEVSAAGPVASLPYVAMTVESLRAFGHRVDGTGPWRVERGAHSPERYDTPGDFSSAVPLLAGAGICGGEVRLTGLPWPSADADALALPILTSMGIEISTGEDEISARADRGKLSPVSAGMTGCPDAVPAVAAAAAFAPGRSRFEGVAHLRWKESDRLEALSSLLRHGGAGATADAGELTVDGGGVGSSSGLAFLPTAGDHRIAMAAGLLSLVRGRALIENPDCVAKSYPGFFRDLEALSRR